MAVAQLKLVFRLTCKQMLTKMFWNRSLWHTATQHKRFAAFHFPTPSLIFANMSFNLFFSPALLERQCRRDTCLCGNIFSLLERMNLITEAGGVSKPARCEALFDMDHV